MSPFWEIDGPARFVRRAVDAVLAHRCVVATLPDFIADDFVQTLTHSMRSESLFPRVVAFDPALSPVETVTHAIRDTSGNGQFIIDQICSYPGVLVIYGVRAEKWRAWEMLLRDVFGRLRSMPQGERVRLVVILHGAGCSYTDDGVVATFCEWRNQLSSLDTQLLAERAIQKVGGEDDSNRIIMRHLVASIGGFDPKLHFELVSMDLGEISQPVRLAERLAEYGRNMGWSRETPESVSAGSLGEVDGRAEVHSALCGLRRDNSAIKTLLWRAEGAALFSYIDNERFEIAQSYGRRIGPAIQKNFPDDWLNLEIGDLWYGARAARLDRKLIDRLSLLRDVRNKLAHREPLEWHEINQCFRGWSR